MRGKRIEVSVNQYGEDMEIRVPSHWVGQEREVTIIVHRLCQEFKILSHVTRRGSTSRVAARQDILRNLGVQDGDRVTIQLGPAESSIFFVGAREGKHLLRVDSIAKELELWGGEGLYHLKVRQLTVRRGEALESAIPKIGYAFGELRPGKALTLPFQEAGLYQILPVKRIDTDWVFRRHSDLLGSLGSLHLTRERVGRWRIGGTELRYEEQKFVKAKRIAFAISRIDNRGHALAIRTRLDVKGELVTDLRYSTGMSRGCFNWTEVEVFKVLRLGSGGPDCIMIRYKTWGGSSHAFFRYSGGEYVKAFFGLHQVGDAVLQFIEEAYDGVTLCELPRGAHQARVALRPGHLADKATRAWGLSDTREIGAMATMILRKLIECSCVLRNALGIKEGWRVEVDEQGLNAGDRYFDIFVNSRRGIVWLGEVKSRWREVADPNEPLTNALSEAAPAVVNRVRGVEGRAGIVPVLGYAIGMYITEDEIYVRWKPVNLARSRGSRVVMTKDPELE